MHAIGTLTTIDDSRYPGTWKVTSNGPKNAVVMPVHIDGTPRPGRGVRVPHMFLIPGTADETKIPTLTMPDEMLYPGTLVRSRLIGDGLFVVLADKGERVNIARIGGDGGRYYRAPRSTVTVVPVPDTLN
jgi:hypothetical protein